MKAKKALSATISIYMLLSMFAVPSYAVGTFTDVADDAYYVDAVQWGVQNNMAAGTGDNKFSPDQICSKAQIIAFIWRAYGYPEVDLDNTLTDLDGSEYYYKAALWGVSKGIGVGDKEFNGDTLCSRNSAMLYLWKAAGEPTATTKATFTDIQNTNNVDGISWAVENKIAYGTSDTTFSPDTTCTRAHIISFLYRNLVKPVEQQPQLNNDTQNQNMSHIPTAEEIDAHHSATDPNYKVNSDGSIQSSAAHGNDKVGIN